MATSDTTFNFEVSRNARAAMSASLAVSIVLLSFSSLIAPTLANQAVSFILILEILVVLGQVGTIISAIVLLLQGNIDLGILRIAFSFLVTGLFRVLVRDEVGLALGVMTATMVSSIGFLALPPRLASRLSLLAYGIGGAMVVFDLYAPSFYTRLPTTDALIASTTNLAIFIFFVQHTVVILHSRALSFASKLTSYFSLFTLLAVVAVGYAGIEALSTQIATGSDVTGFARLTLKILERWMILTGVAVSFLGAVLGVLIARTLTDPLSRLAKATGLVASGNFEARAVVTTEDEVGELTDTFNSMADSLKDLVGQLEIRVQDRTRDLQRRSLEIQGAVEIGRIVTSMRDLESLLTRTTQLITQRFGFYHAGIFLVDQAREYADLHAASSDGGKQMLEVGHRLKVGETGIVGFVTQAGQARIALDVGQDAVFFDNPYLPDTRSEMALPLIAGGVVLGALDVQSTEAQAFDEQDIDTLQILADQLAIAIENARLFSETQNALEAARVAYGELSREAWAKIIRTQPRLSYVAAQSGGIQQNSNPPSMDILRTLQSGDIVVSDDGRTLGIPVKVRGQSIGALKLRKQDTANAWTQEETALATALSEQLSGALESARLYKESQQRAARETLVSDISARITALPRVDTIVRETVQELGRAIGNAAITFQLLESPDKQEQLHGPGDGSGAAEAGSRKDKE